MSVFAVSMTTNIHLVTHVYLSVSHDPQVGILQGDVIHNCVASAWPY